MNKQRILLIDDDVSFTTLLKLNLTKFEVCVENSPLQAARTALSFKPDLIFLDVVMPEADGGTVAAEFRQDPILGGIPIVFLTAIIPQTAAGRRQEISGYQFLAKPVQLEDLLASINDHLGVRPTEPSRSDSDAPTRYRVEYPSGFRKKSSGSLRETRVPQHQTPWEASCG